MIHEASEATVNGRSRNDPASVANWESGIFLMQYLLYIAISYGNIIREEFAVFQKGFKIRIEWTSKALVALHRFCVWKDEQRQLWILTMKDHIKKRRIWEWQTVNFMLECYKDKNVSFPSDYSRDILLFNDLSGKSDRLIMRYQYRYIS